MVANNKCEGPSRCESAHGVARELRSGVYPQLLKLNSPEEIFKRAVDLSSVREVVRALLSDAERLELAAQGSYSHTLGFEKILLGRDSNDVSLRLHIWWPQPAARLVERQRLLVHGHRWDFWSRVLLGSLESEEYWPAASALSVYAYACHPPLGQGFHRMQALGRQTLQSSGPVVQPSGTVYELTHQRMHRVVADRTGITATLVLRGATKQAASVVCSSVPIVNYEHIELSKLNVLQIHDVLTRFLAATESH